jgi:hypothetical protein
MKTLLTLFVGLLLLFALSVVLASNFGGENVVLRTADIGGGTHETRLWVQDLDGSEWLRAGSPGSRWYRRLLERPMVDMKCSPASDRGGQQCHGPKVRLGGLADGSPPGFGGRRRGSPGTRWRLTGAARESGLRPFAEQGG